MKKYIYFMTNEPQWFDIAVKLYDNNIAEPYLWMGNWHHYKKAKDKFGDEVVEYFDFFKFTSHKIIDTDYKSNFNDFFTSNEYFIAKDRVLKMMDRLDDLSSLSRLDREAIFNLTVVWILNKFEKQLPDALISVENPHTHIQYTLFQICNFYKIPCVKFTSWTFLPLLICEYVNSGKPFLHNIKINKNYLNEFSNFIDQYINNISSKSKSYKAHHIEIERLQSKQIKWKLSKVKEFFKDYLRKFKSLESYTNSLEYNPLNPFKISPLRKSKIINKRRIQLKKEINSVKITKLNTNDKFVYFGLHYEPERTTLPDGGRFHDQFLALVKLREFVPDEIKIYVKEHPSMFYKSTWGYRGRSPLFYRLINNLNNVSIVDTNIKTMDLMNSSLFTSTISGTLGLESAVLGKKSLLFGEHIWYQGCPNTYNWTENLLYDEFIKKETFNEISVKDFFKDKLANQSILGLLNSRTNIRFNKFIDSEFRNNQTENIYKVLECFFKKSQFK